MTDTAPEPDGHLHDRVHSTDWDTLIVLDSCRYDYFERFYRDTPNLQQGSLDRVYSPGRATPETLSNVFDGEYDWTVYSSHPWINSTGNEIPAEKTQDHLGAYAASDHFSRIHNVWQNYDHSDNERRTLTEYVLDRIDAVRDERSIIWSMGPHMPYNGSFTVDLPGNWMLPDDLFTESDGTVSPGIQTFIRTAYKSCLLRSLYHAAVIAGACTGTVVVTSDHGEQLFYGGDTLDWVGHRVKNDTHHLHHVPWLELDGSELTNLAWAGTNAFIDACYQAVLNRSVGEQGLDWYGEGLSTSGDLMRPQMLEILLSSPEYEENIDDPNDLGLGKTIDYTRPDTDTMDRLRDLGYR